MATTPTSTATPTREQLHHELAARLEAAERAHPPLADRDSWRDAQRQARFEFVCDQLGRSAGEALTGRDLACLRWLAGWDADVVVGVARLIRLARHRGA